MDVRVVVVGLVVVGASALAACGTGGTPSRTFLFTHLEIGTPLEPSAGGRARSPGVEMDGVDTVVADSTSVICADRALDYVSEDDPPLQGVDNALGAVARGGGTPWPTPEPEGSVRDLVASGVFMAGIELGGVDSLVDDPHVEVRLVRLVVADCDAGEPTCSPHIDNAAMLAEQRFTQSELAMGEGSIVDGRLIARLPEWSVPIEALSAVAPAGTRVRLDDVRLSAVLDEGNMVDGSLGAALAVDEALRVVVTADPTVHVEEIRGALEAFADLGNLPDEAGCTHISGGYRFAAVAVRIMGTL